MGIDFEENNKKELDFRENSRYFKKPLKEFFEFSITVVRFLSKISNKMSVKFYFIKKYSTKTKVNQNKA